MTRNTPHLLLTENPRCRTPVVQNEIARMHTPHALHGAKVCVSASRQATVRTSRHSYVKDLSRLGRDLRHTVLVDNDPFSGLLQPRNLLPVVPYHGDARDRQGCSPL